MRMEKNSVVFEWSEVRQFFPELSFSEYELLELIGRDSHREFTVDDCAEIAIETTDKRVRFRVTLNAHHRYDTLSSLIAECERIIASATKGVFQELEVALKMTKLLRPYFERIVQQVVERTTQELCQQIKLLEAKLQELQQKKEN